MKANTKVTTQTVCSNCPSQFTVPTSWFNFDLLYSLCANGFPVKLAIISNTFVFNLQSGG